MSAAEWYVMEEVLETLLKANQKLHEHVRKGLEEIETSQHLKYVRDFRTIRLSYGQRTGKSCAIVNMAGPQDLIIVSSANRLPDFRESQAEVKWEGAIDSFQNSEWPRIWIDEASWYLDMDQLQDLYIRLEVSPDQQVILLG